MTTRSTSTPFNKAIETCVAIFLVMLNYFLLSTLTQSQSAFVVCMSVALSILELEISVLVSFKITEKRVLKSLGMKSMQEVIDRTNKINKYLTEIYGLPAVAKIEVNDKLNELQAKILDYDKQPDWVFTNKGTTKKDATKQLEKEFNQWMKSKGYPTVEF